jgi:hypothetical protein
MKKRTCVHKQAAVRAYAAGIADMPCYKCMKKENGENAKKEAQKNRISGNGK